MIVRPCAVIEQQKKILLLEYRYGSNDVYALPGGNPTDDETLQGTLTRELKEELGIEVELGRLAFAGEVLIPGKEPVLHCAFLAHIIGGTPSVNRDHTTALDLAWRDIGELPSLNLYPNIGRDIAGLLSGKKTDTNPYIGPIRQQWF